MKKRQAHDYISDNVRFNQDAKDKQDWNRYTMICTVTKEIVHMFYYYQDVGIDECKCGKEIGH